MNLWWAILQPFKASKGTCSKACTAANNNNSNLFFSLATMHCSPSYKAKVCSATLASLSPTCGATIASSLSQPSAQQVAAPQSKKFRPPQKSQRYIPKPIPLELGNLKTYSNPDILICGNCRELFNDLVDMLEHKKNYCKMRFTCRCEQKEEGEETLQPQKAITDASNAGCEPPPSSGKRVCL